MAASYISVPRDLTKVKSNNFKRLGVQARTLNGKERLALMHQQLHMGDKEKFNFDWKYLLGSGLSVKDFIAPSGFAFPNGKKFQIKLTDL